jgi:diacylglycerol kinase (ATP)
MSFSISQRLRSFVYAFRGAGVLLASEHNAWIHLAATGLVVTCGFIIQLTAGEWVAISISIGMVWCAEAINTAIELLADEISLERRDRIGRAKDVAAFAVLVSATSAVVVGAIVFGGHLLGRT